MKSIEKEQNTSGWLESWWWQFGLPHKSLARLLTGRVASDKVRKVRFSINQFYHNKEEFVVSLRADLFKWNLFKRNLFERNIFERNLFVQNIFEINLFKIDLFKLNLFKIDLFKINLFKINLFEMNLFLKQISSQKKEMNLFSKENSSWKQSLL